MENLYYGFNYRKKYAWRIERLLYFALNYLYNCYFTTKRDVKECPSMCPPMDNKVRPPPSACHSTSAAAKPLRPPTKKETSIEGASLPPWALGVGAVPTGKAFLIQKQTSPLTRAGATAQWSNPPHLALGFMSEVPTRTGSPGLLSCGASGQHKLQSLVISQARTTFKMIFSKPI